MQPARLHWGWHLASVCVLSLAALVNTWSWFAADRMPPGDFPGYAAQVQYVRGALLDHGRVPLWCVECYGGTTNFTSHLKEYLAFPLAVGFEPVLATKLLFVILKVVAALGLYACVVICFGTPLVGVVAGYAYGFGAIANHQVEHLDAALAVALLPPILLAALELLRRGGAGSALALGVLVACQLANNWVHAASAPLVVALLLLLRPWREHSAQESAWGERGLGMRWALRCAAALAVFLAFAGSELAWIANDARNHRLVPAASSALQRGFYVERSPFLFLNRDNVLAPWLAEHQPPGFDLSAWDAGRRYVGVVVLAVLVAGGLAGRRDAALRSWAALAGLLFLFQYWLSLGPRTLLWEVAESLHATPEMQAGVQMGLRVTFVACLLVAGLGAAARAWRPGARVARVGFGSLIAAALVSFFPTASLWSVCARALPALEVQRSPGHFFDTASFWLYLLFALGLVALGRSLSRPRLASWVVAAAAVGVVADFWPSRSVFAAGVPMQRLRRAGEMLAQLPGDGGTLRIGLPFVYSPLASWVAAQASAGHAWGWLPWQAGRHWGDLMLRATYSAASIRTDGRAPLVPDLPLLEAARVRYFLLGSDADPLPAPWRRVGSEPPFAVWEQPVVAPMAQGVRADAPSADESARDDPALIARALRESPAPFAVTYQRPQPEHIVLDLEAGAEQALVFVSEGHHPWWKATVDGEPAPVLRAQLAMLAVPVGPGSDTIELRLERPAVVAAADRVTALAWIALALGAPTTALVRSLQRRRR